MAATASVLSGMGAQPPDHEMLPPLREDLQLLPASRQESGAPAWHIYDPVRHAFFRIGWLEFEILSRWHHRTPERIARHCRETTMRVSPRQVVDVRRFLARHQLLQEKSGRGPAARGGTAGIGPLGSFVTNHLYRRLPLWRPDRFLEATGPAVSFFFTGWFWKTTGLLFLLGLYLVSRQWEEFSRTFLYLFTLPGMIGISVAIITVKFAHELAHAYTAKHFDLKVPVIGLALLIIWPLFYTDTTDAWRLTDRHKRLKIGAAGVLLELTVAIYATFLWTFFEPGPVRSVLFLLATATWLTSLAVNLNPFMRFDGYYLLSDWWDISNLQPRAFAVGRWYLRRILFGIITPAPDELPRGKRRLLFCYGVATWCYRLIIFTAIALLIYHLAFKLLGIFLFAVEIGWFVVRPILKELQACWRNRRTMRSSRVLTTVALLGSAIVVFVYPWPRYLTAPAVCRPAGMMQIHAPESGRLEIIRVGQGQGVKKGEILFELDSPELDFLEEQAGREVARLKLELKRVRFAEERGEDIRVLEQQLTAALTALTGYKSRRERLRITAPISGKIAELPDHLAEGQWINSSLRLCLVIDTGGKIVEGYLREGERWLVRPGSPGQFYPDSSELPAGPGTVHALDETHTASLDEPYLASLYGGGLAVRRSAGGEMVSEDTLYRFLFGLNDGIDYPERMLRGEVRLKGAPMSFLERIWQAVCRVAIRESEF